MKNRSVRVAALLLAFAPPLAAQSAPPDPNGYLANDSHFHLTNYIQEGPTLPQFLKMMGNKVGRVALFGIPLQQTWSQRVDGTNAPTYYLGTDAPLYYYSFTDAAIAMAYRALPPAEQARFEPMITGFNPADMYAADHIRRVLQTFPGVFTGIGEFTIHKEFVSAKVAGVGASLLDPALDRILDFAAEAGLVAIIHSDIDVPYAKPGSADASLNMPYGPPAPVPEYLAQISALFRRHPKTTIIWAHTGLGRTVRPIQDHVKMIGALAADPALPNLYFDISWKVVADYVVASDSSLTAAANLINKFPDRFLYGSDALAPPDQKSFLEVFEEYGPLWKRLTPEASEKVRKENFARIFDTGRRRVRAWERAHPK
jgi:predicted TIM-barrel fold metal-dependent hydrolase